MLQAPALQFPTPRFETEAQQQWNPQMQPLMGIQPQFGMDNGGMGFVFYPETDAPDMECQEPEAVLDKPEEAVEGGKKTRDAKVKKSKKEKGMLCC